MWLTFFSILLLWWSLGVATILGRDKRFFSNIPYWDALPLETKLISFISVFLKQLPKVLSAPFLVGFVWVLKQYVLLKRKWKYRKLLQAIRTLRGFIPNDSPALNSLRELEDLIRSIPHKEQKSNQ